MFRDFVYASQDPKDQLLLGLVFFFFDDFIKLKHTKYI